MNVVDISFLLAYFKLRYHHEYIDNKDELVVIDHNKWLSVLSRGDFRNYSSFEEFLVSGPLMRNGVLSHSKWRKHKRGRL